jgi:hypothetical protein
MLANRPKQYDLAKFKALKFMLEEFSNAEMHWPMVFTLARTRKMII